MFSKPMAKKEYEKAVMTTRNKRMKWWREARFGMFVHFGPYAVLGRNEWIMCVEGYSSEEYEREAVDKFHPKKGCAEQWARLASEAGCKYMVLTTRHHDGFSLWESKTNPYNIVTRNGGHDIVAEYVDACRKYGLKIGFYHSVMDWHNPDGSACMWDMDARLRFIQFHRGMLKELFTQYGKIDVLWYDCSCPMEGMEFDFVETNRMVRHWQPDIIINPRSGISEDFDTPEGHIKKSEKKDWEACMTFNDLSWGYVDSRQAAPHSYNAHRIARMLSAVSAGGGNLLLNIGPTPDGSVPPETVEPLQKTGKWLKTYGEAIYGPLTCVSDATYDGAAFWTCSGNVSVSGNNLYLWDFIAPVNGIKRVNGILSKVVRVTDVSDGREYKFEQNGFLLKIYGFPEGHTDPDGICSIFRVECETPPAMAFSPTCKPISRLQNPETFDFGIKK